MTARIKSTLDFQKYLRKSIHRPNGRLHHNARETIGRIVEDLFETTPKEQDKVLFLSKLVVLIREFCFFKKERRSFNEQAFQQVFFCFMQYTAHTIVVIENQEDQKPLEDKIFTLIFMVKNCFDGDILSKFPPVVQEFYNNQHSKELSERRDSISPLSLLPPFNLSPKNGGEVL